MSTWIILPEDSRKFSKWMLINKHIYAEAVLLGPARGKNDDQRILVLKGSKLRGEETPTCPPAYRQLRQKLIPLGPVEPHYEDWILTEHVVFNCPCAASSVMLGKSSNGWDLWKWNDDRGPSLHEVELGRFKPEYFQVPPGSFDLGSARTSWY